MSVVIPALLPRGAQIVVKPIENSTAREVCVSYATLPDVNIPTLRVDDDGRFGLPPVLLDQDGALALAIALTTDNDNLKVTQS